MGSRLVPSTSAKTPGLFYGPPMIPAIRGFLVEYDTKDEYIAARDAYRESEANCNTCRFLERVKHEKDPHGFIPGICTKVHFRPAIRFHPDDPMHNPCWESRRVS